MADQGCTSQASRPGSTTGPVSGRIDARDCADPCGRRQPVLPAVGRLVDVRAAAVVCARDVDDVRPARVKRERRRPGACGKSGQRGVGVFAWTPVPEPSARAALLGPPPPCPPKLTNTAAPAARSATAVSFPPMLYLQTASLDRSSVQTTGSTAARARTPCALGEGVHGHDRDNTEFAGGVDAVCLRVRSSGRRCRPPFGSWGHSRSSWATSASLCWGGGNARCWASSCSTRERWCRSSA